LVRIDRDIIVPTQRGIIALHAPSARKRAVSIVHLAGFVIASADHQDVVLGHSIAATRRDRSYAAPSRGRREAAHLWARQRNSVAAVRRLARVDGMLIFSQGQGIGWRNGEPAVALPAHGDDHRKTQT